MRNDKQMTYQGGKKTDFKKNTVKTYSKGWTISNWKAIEIFPIQAGFRLFIITSVRPISSSLPSLFFAYTTAMGSLYDTKRHVNTFACEYKYRHILVK